MAKPYTIHIPMGYVANITTDAVSSGYYTRLGNPGGDAYSPTAISASGDVNIGPFNEPRNYELLAIAGDILVASLNYSGVMTAADDSALAPKASPTFTGTVVGVNPLWTVTSYASNGAIATGAGAALLTKATAGAYTLAANATDGTVLVITSGTNAAHVVTATSLIRNGVVGGLLTTLTFDAYIGASVTLMAIGSKWHVLSNNAVVIT